MKNRTKNKQQRRKLKRTLRRRVKRGGMFTPSKYRLNEYLLKGEITRLLSGDTSLAPMGQLKKILDESNEILVKLSKLLNDEEEELVLTEILKLLPEQSFNKDDLTDFIIKLTNELQYKEKLKFLKELLRIIKNIMIKDTNSENIGLLIELIRVNQITPLPSPPQLPPRSPAPPTPN